MRRSVRSDASTAERTPVESKDSHPARAIWIGLALVLLSVLPQAAMAELTPCRNITDVAGKKIVVDDVGSHRGDPIAPASRHRIISVFGAHVGALKADDDQIKINIETVICQGRWPEDRHAFDTSEIETLEEEDVLLELWGTIVDDQTVDLGYFILPLFQHDPEPKAFYYNTHDFEESEHLHDLFDQATEVKAYASLALGLEARDEAERKKQNGEAAQTEYNEARQLLCLAREWLADAEEAARGSFWAGDLKVLGGFVDRWAREVGGQSERLDELLPGDDFACPGGIS